MDEQTLARLKRAAGPKPTGPAGLDSPRVVRRSDLVAAITELEHCADGTAFDADELDYSTPEGVQAALKAARERLSTAHDRWRGSFGGRA